MRLGILGGGQLGMMSAQAAKKLGISVIIYTPEKNPCSAGAADEVIQADYNDTSALDSFAQKCDIITYEFENIPIDTVLYIQSKTPVYPDENLLRVSQDRIAEKSFLNNIGIHTAKWCEIKGTEDIIHTLNTWKTEEIILKTTRFGYDGKGQIRIKNHDTLKTDWTSLNTPVAIAESIIDFAHEVSVIVARDLNDDMVHYGPMLNHHKNHILSETQYPSGLSADLEQQAIQMTRDLAHQINLRGVLCLELFITKDGKILANEIAPRTHNSGHWTIDACDASQFENHVRAVCGLPIANPNPRPARMINLIGEDIKNLDPYKSNPKTYIHDYGKTEILKGRKMGHVTTLQEQ